MSYQKEPLYFGSDLSKTPHEFAVLEKDRYLDLFRKGGGHRIRGEASVMYLSSKTAAQEIFDFNPAARILIMLRNPVDVIYSHRGQLHWGGYENLADFEEALAAEADRRAGRRIPKSALVKEALFYRMIGLFGQQVDRTLSAGLPARPNQGRPLRGIRAIARRALLFTTRFSWCRAHRPAKLRNQESASGTILARACEFRDLAVTAFDNAC
jgi:hypothetical protein